MKCVRSGLIPQELKVNHAQVVLPWRIGRRITIITVISTIMLFLQLLIERHKTRQQKSDETSGTIVNTQLSLISEPIALEYVGFKSAWFQIVSF